MEKMGPDDDRRERNTGRGREKDAPGCVVRTRSGRRNVMATLRLATSNAWGSKVGTEDRDIIEGGFAWVTCPSRKTLSPPL